MRQMWRRLRGKMRAGLLYRWRYSGRTPERLLLAPPDLRLADPQIAREFYHGRYLLAGHLVDTGGTSPFQVDVQNEAWLESLHGFRWLRHLHAAETELAAAHARAMVQDWISLYSGRIADVAWQPHVTSRRLIAWLQHSSVILQGADLTFYRLFLKHLAVQMRYLRSVVREMPDGEERLRVRIALAFSALSLPTPPAAIKAATRQLQSELSRQILPDGGHVSRNPDAIVELLSDLLPLRQTYGNQADAAPVELVSAVDRMMPALRFFRHHDGTLARFNGMGVTFPDRVTTILRHDDTAGAPLFQAPYSGYQRLAMDGTTVIADTAAPPPVELSHRANAGCLSFEMSSGRHQFIVNCGIDTCGDASFRALSRATAAHSTLVVNDTSQARFSHASHWGEWIGTPLIGGPENVVSNRIEEQGAQGFIASHDGYASRFGLIHERMIRLESNGGIMRGHDRLRVSHAGPIATAAIAVRFHLHPDIKLYHSQEGYLILAGENSDTWGFACDGVVPRIEESIFFSSFVGPLRSLQIVLPFSTDERSEIRWKFVRTGIGPGRAEATGLRGR